MRLLIKQMMHAPAKAANRKKGILPRGRRKLCSGKVPIPHGATVELRHVSGTEPELLRNRAMLEAVCEASFRYPNGRFAGRGIVICGGGEKYLASVYVLVRLLRHLRCGLPIEVWHLGKEEMPNEMRIAPAPLPRCMSMITPADVIRAIERYHEAGATPWLRRADWNLATAHLTTTQSIKKAQP